MSIHLDLAATLSETFAAHLAAPVELKQDALIVALANGLTVTVRYAARDAYSLRWRRGDAECGIDTAPVHSALATFPNHFHDAAGRTLADPLTDPDAAPADNVTRLLRTLVEQPAFGFEAGD
jgi:hypothetical protein